MKKGKFTTLLILLFSISIAYSQSRSFTGKPIYQILTKRAGVDLGTITVELFPNLAPLAVKNFDSLVNVHFYDTTAFHRVIPGFMIQGGDPNSRHGDRSTWGYGDPSQPTVNAEFTAARHVRGILSAARAADTNSATSQFFICVADASWLNGHYSIYGHATAGMDVVDTIVNSSRDSLDNPFEKIEMFVTYVGSNDSVPVAPVLTSPANGSFSSSSVRTFTWNPVSDAIVYQIEIATDSSFSTLFRTVGAGSATKTVTALSGGTTYYWRVKTNNGGHFSEYSDVWKFSVSGVGIESYEAREIAVSPNPSSGEFLFSNVQPESRIEIMDVTGRKIVESVFLSDSKRINLSDKARGVYFYRIIDPQMQLTQGKIILR